ncbi:MAG: hypothetical protein U0002_17695 [Thermoanaerobaculia bacterium]
MRTRILLLALALLGLPAALSAAEAPAPAADLSFLSAAGGCNQPEASASPATDLGVEPVSAADLGIPVPDNRQLPLCIQSVCSAGCTAGSLCAISINPVGTCCQTGGFNVCCIAPKQLHKVICPCQGTGCTGSDVRLRCI